jgi:alpha-tubulin suppressor-like RCC1 family protein
LKKIAVDLIAAGDNHSIAGNSVQGKVYLWGSYRTTSSGSFASKKELPERIGEDEFKKNKKIDKILSGSNHTLVLTD